MNHASLRHDYRAQAPGFSRFAQATALWSGHPAAFLLAVVVVRIVAGPIFNYSDTWQLVINTGTTIVTFLMVFLIQNTQNRDTMAIQIKLSGTGDGIKRIGNHCSIPRLCHRGPGLRRKAPIPGPCFQARRIVNARIALMAGLIVAVSAAGPACAHQSQRLTGIASVYSDDYSGETAAGEEYDPDQPIPRCPSARCCKSVPPATSAA